MKKGAELRKLFSFEEVSYIRDYLSEYYKGLSKENIMIGKLLFRETSRHGRLLDVGCGPSLLYWALFMRNVHRIDAGDILPANIKHINHLLKEKIIEKESVQIVEFIYSKILKKKIDNNQIKQEILKTYNKIGSLKKSDITKTLGFNQNSYDYVSAIFCVDCLRDYDELYTAVKNMRNCLKKGGKIILVTLGGTTTWVVQHRVIRALRITKDILEHILFFLGFKNIRIERHSALVAKELREGYENILFTTAIRNL